MDTRFAIGAALCVVTIAWTVWLYWSDLIAVPFRAPRAWPWLGITIILIELIVPGYILHNKARGYPGIAEAAMCVPQATPAGPNPTAGSPCAEPPNIAFNGTKFVAKGGTGVLMQGTNNTQFRGADIAGTHMWTAPVPQEFSRSDRIACIHMSGLLMRLVTAGQDGFPRREFQTR
jgi:hypothetical protein